MCGSRPHDVERQPETGRRADERHSPSAQRLEHARFVSREETLHVEAHGAVALPADLGHVGNVCVVKATSQAYHAPPVPFVHVGPELHRPYAQQDPNRSRASGLPTPPNRDRSSTCSQRRERDGGDG